MHVRSRTQRANAGRRSRRLGSPGAALLIAALTASCSEFTFHSQSLALHWLPQDDAVELRLLYVGLAPGNRGDQPAAEAIAKLVEGDRFALLSPAVIIDADALRAMESEPLEAAEDRRLARWLRGFEITDAGLFETGDDRLAVWQVVRLPHADEGLRRINDALSRGIRQSMLEEEGRLEPPLGDPSLTDRYLAVTVNDYRWLQLDDRGLTARFPATPRGLAYCLRELVDDLPCHGPGAGLLQSLATVSMEDGDAELVFAPADDGWIRFRATSETRPVSESFRAAVHAAVPELREPPSWVGDRLDGK